MGRVAEGAQGVARVAQGVAKGAQAVPKRAPKVSMPRSSGMSLAALSVVLTSALIKLRGAL